MDSERVSETVGDREKLFGDNWERFHDKFVVSLIVTVIVVLTGEEFKDMFQHSSGKSAAAIVVWKIDQ
jgi:hypothetical protein